MLGVRNLVQAANKPVIEAWLTQPPTEAPAEEIEAPTDVVDEGRYREPQPTGALVRFEPDRKVLEYEPILRHPDDADGPATSNPTFGKNLELGTVELGSEPLLWPWLVIECRERDSTPGLFGRTGCE